MGWVFPQDVDGWLTLAEGRKLADLARDKRVLEIGSFKGRSTICMAQTARFVTCIDPFDGRATSEPGSTYPAFCDNIDQYDCADKVDANRGTTKEIAPQLHADGERYEFIFIDGAHDYESVQADIQWATKLLIPGGVIAFHDYREFPGQFDGRWDPDVSKAVNEFVAGGGTMIDRADSVAVVRPDALFLNGAVRQPRRVDPVKPLVFLGMPMYDGRCSIGAAEGFFIKATRGKCDVARAHHDSSFLTKTFNELWCAALNERERGVTHFAMIHDDISPHQFGWLDILYSELVRCDADVMSAVSPIKGPPGWTSTAMGRIGLGERDSWACRRLTMHEVYKLPETFNADDVRGQFGFDGDLLLNTGLWICRLDRPWCEQVCFDVFNRMIRNPNGRFHRHAVSEDWLFSAALNSMGAKLYATRKVTLTHHGRSEFSTDHPWGTDQTDQVFLDSISATRGQGHAEDQVCEGLSGEGNDLGPGAAKQEAVAGV